MRYIILFLLMIPSLLANEYWLAVPPNEVTAWDKWQALELYIISNKPTEITVEYNNSVFVGSCDSILVYGLPADWETRAFDTVYDNSIHVFSDDSINVYLRSSKKMRSDAFLALPVERWGTHYFHCSYYEYSEMPTYPRGTGFIIVSGYDNTKVQIIVRGVGNYTLVGGYRIGDTIEISLNRRQIVTSCTYPEQKPFGAFDITGTEIISDKPIGLISFNMATKIPFNEPADGRDPLFEMLPPVRAWGCKYVTREFARQGRGDLFRIVASEKTKFTIKSYNLDGVLIKSISSILERGQFYEDNFAGFTIFEADQPIMVNQYSYSGAWDNDYNYDPFQVVLSANTVKQARFQTPDGLAAMQSNWINVISTGPVSIDGEPLEMTPCQGYYHCAKKIEPGLHELKGEGFAGYVYGFGPLDSYGYPLSPDQFTEIKAGRLEAEGYNFGRVRKKTLKTGYITLKNTGQDKIIFDVTGENPFTFELHYDTLQAGEELKLKAYFNPPGTGYYSQNFIVTSNYNSDTINLKGMGVWPILEIADYDFDTTIVNYSQNLRNIKLINKNYEFKDEITVFEVKTPDFSHNFQPVKISHELEFNASFMAKKPGKTRTTVAIITDADTAYSIWTGFGIKESLWIDYNCPSICVGDTGYIDILIYNNGTEMVNFVISNIRKPFYVTQNIFSIEPGTPYNLIIESRPKNKGVFIQELLIYNNTETQNPIKIDLFTESYRDELYLIPKIELIQTIGEKYLLVIDYIYTGIPKTLEFEGIIHYDPTLYLPDTLTEPGKLRFAINKPIRAAGRLFEVNLMLCLPHEPKTTTSLTVDAEFEGCLDIVPGTVNIQILPYCADEIRSIETDICYLGRITPNPAKEEIEIRYNVGIESFTQIIIFDIWGNKILRPVNEIQQGYKVLEIDVSVLPNGIYFVWMETENFTAGRGFIK